LFHEEYADMVRLAYVLTRNQHDAEEVVQDAFLEVSRRWSGLLNPGGYLRTAVVNGAHRTTRRADNRRRIVRLNTRVIARPDPTPDHDLYLVDVLDSLPERQRTAVVLAYYAGLTSREIAETLDCRPGTAKSLVHRGLNRIRKEIGDE
jgi:RNA polymerase sigma factor (sigma-70 family)